ncbi:hypothetical protein AAA215_12450 [Phocaeicola vulgatus]
MKRWSKAAILKKRGKPVANCQAAQIVRVISRFIWHSIILLNIPYYREMKAFRFRGLSMLVVLRRMNGLPTLEYLRISFVKL